MADIILPHDSRPNFARYGIGGEISITTLVCDLDSFQEKLMTSLGKNELPKKKCLVSFSMLQLFTIVPNIKIIIIIIIIIIIMTK